MQVPGIVDQVLLEWNGGDSVVLARVKDAEGCWLCGAELYRKLGSSAALWKWYHFIKKGEQRASV